MRQTDDIAEMTSLQPFGRPERRVPRRCRDRWRRLSFRSRGGVWTCMISRAAHLSTSIAPRIERRDVRVV